MAIGAEHCTNRGLIAGRITKSDGKPLAGGYVYLDFIRSGSGFLSVYTPRLAGGKQFTKILGRTDEKGYFFLEFRWSGAQLGLAVSSQYQVQVIDPGPVNARFIAGKRVFRGRMQKAVSLGAIAGYSTSGVLKGMGKGLLKAYDEYRRNMKVKLADNLLNRTPSPEYYVLLGVVAGVMNHRSMLRLGRGRL